MLTNYHPQLFLLVIAFIFLLFLPLINCSSDQIKESSIDKQIQIPITKNHFYDLLKQEEFNSHSAEEEEEVQQLIEDILKTYPHRRAASFYAMRGKRFIKTA